MYITGISAFITAYMKFIWSTLVKTQRINIRIYFDRKNNYFIAMYTFIKNPMHLKYCYLQKCIGRPIMLFISYSNKTSAFSFMSHLIRVL